jgi:(p)ppGpp synthase/HD superfamily hydrolase
MQKFNFAGIDRLGDTPLEKAVNYATDIVHKDQKRKDGQPYAVHPLRVALVLARYFISERERTYEVLEFRRKIKERFGGAAEEIVADYRRLSEDDYDQQRFKIELLDLEKYLSPNERKWIGAALFHDAPEETITHALGTNHNDDVVWIHSEVFNYIFPGSQLIVKELTDPYNSDDNEIKHAHQMKQAKEAPATMEEWIARLVRIADKTDNQGDLQKFPDQVLLSNVEAEMQAERSKIAGKISGRINRGREVANAIAETGESLVNTISDKNFGALIGKAIADFYEAFATITEKKADEVNRRLQRDNLALKINVGVRPALRPA